MEKKRYFIGFALEGKAKEHAEKVAHALGEIYGLRNVFKRYPPHLTLKIPFDGIEAHEIEHDLIPYLEKFVRGRKMIDLDIDGFGHFSRGVIYCDILEGSDLLMTLQAELCEGLEQFSWMTFGDIEPNGIPHVTVAQGDIKGRFKDIFKYLKGAFPSFEEFSIDKIQLFEKRADRWLMIQEFPLDK